MAAQDDVTLLVDRYGASLIDSFEFRGEQTVKVLAGSLHQILHFCRHELGYDMLIDISSIDHFGDDPRFEVVYELATVDDTKHLRIKSPISEDQELPTCTDIWAAANWHEREVYDMMGIRFTDHPEMRRILMWEGYPYYPLRKDFPLAGRPSEMPDVASTGVAPLEGGPFVTTSGGQDTIRREPRAQVVD